MHLFKITCETCRARLSVRDESAIGQIVACPKCSSMVHIVAPAGWSAASAVGGEEAAAAAAPPAGSPSPQPPTEASHFVTPVAPPPVNSLPSSESSPDLPPSGEPPPATFQEGDGMPPLDPAWASPAEQLSRKVVYWSAAAGIAVFSIGAIVGAYLSAADPPSSVAATANGAAVAPPGDGDDASPQERGEAGETAESAASPPQTSKKQAAADHLPPPVVPELTSGEDEGPELSKQPESTTGEEAGPLVLEDDPPLAADPDAEPTPLIDEASSDAADGEPMDEPDVGADEHSSARIGVSRIEPPLESASETIDVAGQLSREYPHFAFTSIPLSRFVSTVSDMTLLPLSLDLDALARAGISPDAAVSIERRNASLSEILSSALASAGLVYETDGAQIVITTQDAAENRLREVRFALDDLCRDRDELADFARLLERAVQPTSWRSSGGRGGVEIADGALRIHQSSAVVYEAILFCEKLRLARGLRPRSKLSPSLFPLETRFSRAAQALAKPVGFTFHEPARLADVVQYIEETSGARLFIDWRSLAKDDFIPRSRISCGVPQQPLAQALHNLLSPLRLSWRLMDDRTVEIFSLADAPRKMQTEFYPLSAQIARGMKPDALIAEIRERTSPDFWHEDLHGLLHYDGPSRYLIVRHIQPVQAAVQRVLSELSE